MTKFTWFVTIVAIAMIVTVLVLTSVGQLSVTEMILSFIYMGICSIIIVPLCLIDTESKHAEEQEKAKKVADAKHAAWVEEKLKAIKNYIPLYQEINTNGGFLHIEYRFGRFDIVYHSNNYWRPYAVRTSFHDDGTVWEDRVGFCNSQYGFETPEDKKLFEEYELIVAWQLGNQDAENFLREREENKI